jgi:ABC-2 type transport system permease protein
MTFLTVAGLTLRTLFGRRRFLLLLPLPALVVGLAVLAETFGADPAEWGSGVLVGLGFAVVLVLSLIVGASVLGSEIDDGTAVHLLTKPVRRSTIVLSKLVVAVVVTWLAVGTGLALAGLVADGPRLALGLLAGTGVGALAYGALFLALSLLTRRPVLVGLAYILVWEGILASSVSGTQVLSIRQYVLAVAERIGSTTLFTGNLSVQVSLIMTAVITVAATVLAIDRLRSFALTGETS